MAEQGAVGRLGGGIEPVQGSQALLEVQQYGPAGLTGAHVVQRSGDEGVPCCVLSAVFYGGEQQAAHVAGEAQAQQLAAQLETRGNQVY